MKITVIGTSCTWFERANTGFILDDKILFDVPVGNYKHIIKHIDIFDLDWIFISHLHDDHFYDFRVIATRFTREMERHNRTEKLKVYCPANTAQSVVELNKIINGAPDETSLESIKKNIDFIPLHDGMEFEENGYRAKVYKMEHGGVETYGLTLTDKTGKTIAFSADTVVCENLKKMLSVSDYALVDMAAARESRTHICIEDFRQLERQFSGCKFFPVHTCDESQEYAEKNKMNYLKDGQILNL